jgi:predicted 3-demethylubiquinone-9 3-methyltransferase (glyoxalase superfamily)
MKKQITPCLWFDQQAEEAAVFYTKIFKNAPFPTGSSKIEHISRYGKEGFEIHGQPEGTVLTVEFLLNGQPFTALNAGPVFTFNEAISLQVYCESQAEIDYYWAKLTEGGMEVECGWLKDKFGVSWQVVPSILSELIRDPSRSEKVTRALFQMKKLDIDQLLNA